MSSCIKKRNIIISILLMFSGIFIIFGGIFEHKRELEIARKKYERKLYIDAVDSYASLFQKGGIFPRENITKEELKKCNDKIEKVVYKRKKKYLKDNLYKLQRYIELKDIVESSFKDGVMIANTNEEFLANLSLQYNQLDFKYQNLIKEQLEEASRQVASINMLVNAVNALFQDNEKSIVRLDINRENYNQVFSLLESVKQDNIRNEQSNYLKRVEQTLGEREREYQRKLVEEKRKRQEEINRSWVKLNIPYISQNLPGVYNGCEVTSLLMCLQYKGYLINMDLISYANGVPKSQDPYQGFVSDIFSLDPRDVIHWIAPVALARYGVTSSGGATVIDSTGYTLDQLDNELSNGNAVIIYLTSNMKTPKYYNGDIPKNLHVVVLSGYNKITGEQIITDPWTKKDGGYEWYLSKKETELIYNYGGKKSVIVK